MTSMQTDTATVICDSCGRIVEGVETITLKQLRRIAKRVMGWKLTKSGLDYCPECEGR